MRHGDRPDAGRLGVAFDLRGGAVWLLDMLPMLGVPLEQVIPTTASQWLQFALSTLVVWWAGWPFFTKAWRSIVTWKLNMFSELNIDRVEAEVSPQDKHDRVQALRQSGRRVAMAGDGINDGPALAAADVGIAMGTGTDVAIEAAGVTLVRGDLQGLIGAIRLTRRTMTNIRQNLFFASLYNVLAIPVAAGVLYPVFGWLLSPMVAAVAMSLSSLCVVGNALRLRPVDFG